MLFRSSAYVTNTIIWLLRNLADERSGCSALEVFVVSEEQWSGVTCSPGLQRPSIWPVCAMWTNTAHKRLPGGTAPHLNNKATKEHYTHERDEGKGGNVLMEQTWEEKERYK